MGSNGLSEKRGIFLWIYFKYDYYSAPPLNPPLVKSYFCKTFWCCRVRTESNLLIDGLQPLGDKIFVGTMVIYFCSFFVFRAVSWCHPTSEEDLKRWYAPINNSTCFFVPFCRTIAHIHFRKPFLLNCLQRPTRSIMRANSKHLGMNDIPQCFVHCHWFAITWTCPWSTNLALWNYYDVLRLF